MGKNQDCSEIQKNLDFGYENLTEYLKKMEINKKKEENANKSQPTNKIPKQPKNSESSITNEPLGNKIHNVFFIFIRK